MSDFLDFLKALAWPAFAFWVLCTFEEPISRFIDRLSSASVGPTGVSLNSDRQKVAEQKMEIEAPALKNEEISAARHEKPRSVDIYDEIDSQLLSDLSAAFPADLDTQLRWAVRRFSQVYVELAHERNYRLMFTSQIIAIKELNVRIRAPIASGRELYDQFAKSNPSAYEQFSYDTWSGFLLNTGYVRLVEGNERMVEITPLGQDFLRWVIGRRVPELKSF